MGLHIDQDYKYNYGYDVDIQVHTIELIMSIACTQIS